MTSLLYGLIDSLALLPILLFAWWQSGARHPKAAWFLVFLGLLILDAIAILLPVEYHINLTFFQWNWFGKALSLAWALMFIMFGPLTRREVGMVRSRANSRKLAWLVVGIAVVACAIGDYLSGPLKPSAQTLAFQLTMPAISEEIVYRGILLAVLARAFRENEFPSRFYLGWSVWITAIAFGLVHSLQVSHGHFHFYPLAFVFPFAFAILAGWLRKYSGSLVLPIVMHSGIDFAAAAVGFI
jgi:hypothetical protein